VADLSGAPVKEILWSLAPSRHRPLAGRVRIEGRILSLTVDVPSQGFRLQPVADLDDSQVFALLPLAGDRVLAGTGGQGGLTLVEGDRPIARVILPRGQRAGPAGVG
jgi:hypothetical protein